ncbi:hypothetical protein GQ53DRAFT_833907 [Thozetella sp. PMI_491]|nr:hypothetical protein GQ53DRAFT_833907 [Thozetella sp. PMI_491]
MRSNLFSILIAALPALALGHVDDNDFVTTVVVKATKTVCPSPPPPLRCTKHQSSTSVPYSSLSSVYTASSTLTSFAPEPTGTDLVEKLGWEVDASDFSNLEPKKYCRMLYVKDDAPPGTKPAEGEPYAWVTMNETAYPIIQTVNSKYFEKVWCDISAGWVKMQFNSEDAYNHAWDSWHGKARSEWGDYVVVTPSLTCKNWDSAQQRHFIRAISETRDDDSMTITCKTQDISLADTIGDDKPMNIQFDNFNQKNVSALADETANGSQTFNDLGGEVLREPSGDSDYDEYLDTLIGRMDLATLNSQTMEGFGLTLLDFYGTPDLPDLATENLIGSTRRKRGLLSKIKKAVKKVADSVTKAVQAVATAVKSAADAVVSVAKAVEQAIADFTTIDKDFTQSLEFDSSRIGKLVTTPFDGKKGYQLLSLSTEKTLNNSATVEASVDVFCVECGVSGDFDLHGELVFIVSRLDFETGFVEVTGAMHAGLGLGIAAEASISKDFTVPIASVPLTPFTIPGILILGPEFKLSAGVNIALSAEGDLLAGVKADWNNVQARMDIVHSSDSFATGFKPSITPVFSVEGSIAMTTTFFLEGSLGVGLNLLNGLFDKSVALVDRPGVFISAGLAASFDLGDGADLCKGIDVAVGFSNELSVNIFDLDDFTIDQESVQLGSRCFDIFAKRGAVDDAEVPYQHHSAASAPARILHSRRAQETPGIDEAEIGNSTFDGGIMAKMYTRDLSNEGQEIRLRYSPNGNTYGVSPDKVPQEDSSKEWSGWFAADTSGAFVVGDSHGRFFHGYRDTLLSMGVSRLRLHAPDEMPRTAQPIVFAAATLEGSPENGTESQLPYLVASDLGGDIYFPILCVYDSGKVYSKLFIANDTETGVATLMSNAQEVRSQVTGATVKECGYVPLTNGLSGVDVSQVADDV